ncbi:WXG100 family type VII secretion target [Streptomyces sp. A3M-1-3]|uniref:WXG100 family type VII secretion target n=1 Tax=Streptomyces sp. A3M-1-3 TaxID=2962044 RepID=UPI0020B6C3EB|nr:WXG100 family type VII secretion target [Streptomyces sp. A3M-1-3]MCP3818379.1 WXG100 family type VII secretion target [Streptomyces sp. A3M-1-3]
MQNAHLDVSEDELTKLAKDMDAMQAYLEQQTRRMDAIVDGIEAGWQGPTARAYRKLHQGAAEDSVRIRQVLVLLEEATRLSRDDFTGQELEILGRLKKMQDNEDVSAAARAMSEPDPVPAPAPARPQSRILDV